MSAESGGDAAESGRMDRGYEDKGARVGTSAAVDPVERGKDVFYCLE